jgi:hypothetical protein
MEATTIKPENIKTPIQLMAVWFAALVLVEGITLSAATAIDDPIWLRSVLALAAILYVPTFLALSFLMQTRFRVNLMGDDHFSAYLAIKEARIENAVKTSSSSSSSSSEIYSPQQIQSLEAFKALNRTQRLVLILREDEQMSFREIAVTLDVPKNEVIEIFEAIPNDIVEAYRLALRDREKQRLLDRDKGE